MTTAIFFSLRRCWGGFELLSCYSFVIAVVVGKRSRQIAALHEHYERQQSQLMAGRVSLSSYFFFFSFFSRRALFLT